VSRSVGGIQQTLVGRGHCEAQHVADQAVCISTFDRSREFRPKYRDGYREGGSQLCYVSSRDSIISRSSREELENLHVPGSDHAEVPPIQGGDRPAPKAFGYCDE
jgi:hypothetical protein